MLKDRLRLVLVEQARAGEPVTYRELTDRLGLAPPQTIQRVAQALEILMAEDVMAGRPMLAALCVSRMQQRLPARGFFITAEALGIFTGTVYTDLFLDSVVGVICEGGTRWIAQVVAVRI